MFDKYCWAKGDLRRKNFKSFVNRAPGYCHFDTKTVTLGK